MTHQTVISILHAQTRPILMKDLAVKCNVSERRLRTLISEIREQGLSGDYILVCGDEGYWLTANPQEIERFLARYLSYAYTMLKTVRHTKKFLTEAQASKIQGELMF